MSEEFSKHKCRWCQGKVRKPRRTWCSDECVRAFTSRNHQAAFNSLVWAQSDKKCAVCRIDLDALDNLIRSVRSFDFREAKEKANGSLCNQRELVRQLKGLFGLDKKDHLWEADHILPQELGGKELNPKLNGRVLCTACHSEKTQYDRQMIRSYKSPQESLTL